VCNVPISRASLCSQRPETKISSADSDSVYHRLFVLGCLLFGVYKSLSSNYTPGQILLTSVMVTQVTLCSGCPVRKLSNIHIVSSLFLYTEFSDYSKPLYNRTSLYRNISLLWGKCQYFSKLKQHCD
jgi:hypothetical protein